MKPPFEVRVDVLLRLIRVLFSNHANCKRGPNLRANAPEKVDQRLVQ